DRNVTGVQTCALPILKSLVSAHDLTKGEIRVDGQELTTHRQEIKQKIGYVPDSPDLFLQLTAMEYWRLMIDIYRINYQDVAAKKIGRASCRERVSNTK